MEMVYIGQVYTLHHLEIKHHRRDYDIIKGKYCRKGKETTKKKNENIYLLFAEHVELIDESNQYYLFDR